MAMAAAAASHANRSSTADFIIREDDTRSALQSSRGAIDSEDLLNILQELPIDHTQSAGVGNQAANEYLIEKLRNPLPVRQKQADAAIRVRQPPRQLAVAESELLRAVGGELDAVPRKSKAKRISYLTAAKPKLHLAQPSSYRNQPPTTTGSPPPSLTFPPPAFERDGVFKLVCRKISC
jgi:hypothetical protein